jgi:hypothetical protein
MLLVKKEIVVEECPTTKCVVEKVPCGVPCGTQSPVIPMPPARSDISTPVQGVAAPLPPRGLNGPGHPALLKRAP